MNLRRAVVWSIVALGIVALACGGWAYGRVFPDTAADEKCRAPMPGYACTEVGRFDLSVYRSPVQERGTPVLILHGGPGFSSAPILKYFSFLQGEHAVFAYDQRGSGYSQSKPELSNYEFNALVEEVDAVRRALIGDARVILVGHSFGGYLALSYAARHPEYVEKLVLVSTPVPQFDPKTVVALMAYGLPPADPVEANAHWTSILPAWFAATFYAPESRQQWVTGPASYAVSMKVAATMFNSLLKDSDYARVRSPVLLIHGVAETPTSGKEQQQTLKRLLPQARIQEMSHSGHWSFMEEPGSFQAAVRQFLKESS